MTLRKFGYGDAEMELTPGQEGEIYAGNLVDERHGGPITIGYGRWKAGSRLEQTMAVDDVMIVLEGRLTVSSGEIEVSAGPGEIVHMPKGETVTIRAHEQDAVTAYVTYPHWREAEG